MMTAGTTVYLNWYDFTKHTEYLCKGEVADNSMWQDTKHADKINVRFHPPGMSGSICHHFHVGQLSLEPDNVPHDDCYLVCDKKTRFFEHDTTVKLKNGRKLNASEAWKQVQQFKRGHWDYEHGHISIDALDEYYQLWHDAIAAKRGYRETEVPSSEITVPYQEITRGYSEISVPYSSKPAEASIKPKLKQLGAQQKITQLSLFD